MVQNDKEGVMPKEYVHDIDYGRTYTTEDDKKIHMGEKAMKIGWMKGEGRGAPVSLCVLDLAVDVDGMAETVAYLNLDRNGLNRLIRVCRKARDDAFGRDE